MHVIFFFLLLYVLKVNLNIFTTDDDVSHITVISQNCGGYVVEKFTKKIHTFNLRDKLLKQFLHPYFHEHNAVI